MSAVLNDRDAILQAATVRIVNPKNAWINLTASAPGFHLNAAGQVDLGVVTVTADLVGLDDDVTFSAVGATLSNAAGRKVDVTSGGQTAIVTATVTSNGDEFKRSLIIPVLRDGAAGSTTYTWIKYADSAAGAGLSDDPTGKLYIGLAHNKPTATESTAASDYTWSLIQGPPGGQGVQGQKGADGQSLYTWIRYSDNPDGTGLYATPNANTMYIGLAVNKASATPSSTKTDYAWSKFRGADGVGTAGARGAGHYYATGSTWSDVVAQAACPGSTPVLNDVVTISSSTYVMEKRWTGSAWGENGVVINGKLIAPDSILASSIDARGLSIKDPAGRVILSAGSSLAEQVRTNPNLAPTPRGWTRFVGATSNRNGDGRFGDGQYFWLGTTDVATYIGVDSPELGIPWGAYYTVSFDAYCEGASRDLNVDVVNDTDWDSAGIYVRPTNTLTRYSFTERAVGSDNARKGRLRMFSLEPGGSVIVIANVKVELGTTVTPWCDSTVTPENVGQRVSPGAITNTQIGGDLFSTNWNWRDDRWGTGWMLRRDGTFFGHDMRLRGSIKGGAFSGYVWPPADEGGGYYIGPEGALFGNKNYSRWLRLGADGTIESLNFNVDANGQVTVNVPILVNPKTQTSLSVSLSFTNQRNRTNTFNYEQFTVFANISGATGDLRYQWSCNVVDGDALMVSDPGAPSCTFKCRGQNITVMVNVSLIVTDASNVVIYKSTRATVGYGTAA